MRRSGAGIVSATLRASSIVVSTRPQPPEQDCSGATQDTRGETGTHSASPNGSMRRFTSKDEM